MHPHSLATACLAALAALQTTAFAQQRPDAGSIQEQQQPRQIPTLPQPGAPDIKTPPIKPAFVGGDIKVKPSAFRFTGNTLVTDAELQTVVAGLIGKETDFNGLADAAANLRQYYASKGYVLTDVYFPEQAFDAAGGVVEFAVVEARIGKVSVTVAEGSGVSQKFASSLANAYLSPGELITQYRLDRPVLLLRDMAGTDAEATVLPGANPGEADVQIAVMPHAPRYEPYVSLDNMGPRSSGEYRLAAGVNVNAPLGIGDVFSARVQMADKSGNALYRLSYGLALGSYGTKLTGSYTESNYELGKQFASLEASGKAEVASLVAVQPLVRGRFTNVFASASVEQKTLIDDIGQSDSNGKKHETLVRAGVLGNASDRTLAGGTTSFSATLSAGHLKLDAQSAALDFGTPVDQAVPSSYGPRTAGNFAKFNLELQRVQYFSDRSSVLVSMIGQYASKNLTSAEKMNLGGPQGVRGYPIGEGIGDQGLLMSAEYRYLTGLKILGESLSLTAFYDYGTIQRDHKRDATTLNSNNTPNTLSLDSLGLGVLLGHEGNYVMTASVSSRLGGPPPTTGDPDSRARVWFLLQKWF